MTMGIHHTVTVTTRVDDEGTPDERRRVASVTMVCTAEPTSGCRTYPRCDCEVFQWDPLDHRFDLHGHEREPGRDCWLSGWFQSGRAVYAGDDFDDMRDDCVPAIDRTGHIVLAAFHEWPEWKWMGEPSSLDSGSTEEKNDD